MLTNNLLVDVTDFTQFYIQVNMMIMTNVKKLDIENILEAFMKEVAERSVYEMENLKPLELKSIIQKSELTSLIISKEYGGKGLNLVDAIEIIQLVAEKSPSIAVMLCMHYHVVATLALFKKAFVEGEKILRDIGVNRALVASAFAEGAPGRDIFTSTVYSKSIEEGGFVISGSKKPCSMASIADYYATSIVDCEDDNSIGIAFVKSTQKGIITNQFWSSNLLKAADSNQVIFEDVKVSRSYIKLGSMKEMADMFGYGLAAFNLMIAAAYLGITKKLSKKLTANITPKEHIYIELYGHIFQAHYSIIGISLELFQSDNLDIIIEQILILRYRIQKNN